MAWRPISYGVLAFLCAVAGCGGSLGTHVLNGRVSVTSTVLTVLSRVDETNLPGAQPLKLGDPCPVIPDMEFMQGAAVVVRNEKGRIISTGTVTPVGVLGSGTGSSSTAGARTVDRCVFSFVLTGVPDASTYTIALANRRAQHYSFSDLQSKNWNIEMALRSG
jgi:hypothetical protein